MRERSGAPETGKVTVSIGGTCVVPLEGRSASGALQLADQNLYAAKRLGRNRVVFHSDEYAMMQTGSFAAKLTCALLPER